MKISIRLAAAAGIAATAIAASAGAASASTPSGHHHDRGGAVFVQTDDPNGNSVVAYDRSADGSLNQAGSYRTGGNGGVLDGSVVDHLASQGAMQYDREHGLLYVVNAGSDSVTVFAVHGDHLFRLQVISSGGDFPVSITTHGHLVYVLNARDGGSIQGYLRIGARLVLIHSWHRGLGLDPTATPEFTHTPGQVVFTPDAATLLVTTKANTNAVEAFGVNRFGAPSTRPVVTPDPGQVPFAGEFDRYGTFVLTEAGSNSVTTFAVHHDGRLTLLHRYATGQSATCWIVGARGNFYASNAGSANLSGYRDLGFGRLASLGQTGTDAGTVDAAVTAHERYLYVQTGAAGIVNGFRVHSDGSLSPVGSVTVPDSVGSEGIAAS